MRFLLTSLFSSINNQRGDRDQKGRVAARGRFFLVARTAGLGALVSVASGCWGQPTPKNSSDAAAFAPHTTRSLRDFGAAGDGRTDDTAAIKRAFATSDRYCLDGHGQSYRIAGTLRVGKNLCLRNAELIQTAPPVDTSPYINRSCPAVQDPSAIVDCKDPAVPASKVDELWKSLSIRTLLIRPSGGRPLRVNLQRVKINRGTYPEQGSRTDAAGIWLDGADRVDFRDVEITGGGKGYGLLITDARNVTLTNLWIHDLIWAPYPGDRSLSQAAVSAAGWNAVPIHEFREKRPGGVAVAKFYGVRIQEQLTCVSLANVAHVKIENARIERCMARFDTGVLPWQTDGLSIGRSSSDVTINGTTIDSAWEGLDVVAGGDGIDRLQINDLTVSNSFSFGLKMGYQLRNARVSRLSVQGAGLSGVVVYGPVRGVRLTGATIQSVGTVRGARGRFSPWPTGNRAGIRIDGDAGSSPQGVVIEDVAVSGNPSKFEFGLLNTVVTPVELVRFRAAGVGSQMVQGNDQKR